MSISIQGKEGGTKSEPNVVPLCDVLLVLLIIFMIVTPLIQRGVDVTIVKAEFTQSMPDEPELVMAIRQDGTVYLNEQKVTLENLQNTLEEALLTVSDRKLYLRADQALEFGKLADMLEIIRASGIEVMGVITDKKTERGG